MTYDDFKTKLTPEQRTMVRVLWTETDVGGFKRRKRRAWLGKGDQRRSHTHPMSQEKRAKRVRKLAAYYNGKAAGREQGTHTLRYSAPSQKEIDAIPPRVMRRWGL